jgi:uncharacterized membrane protein
MSVINIVRSFAVVCIGLLAGIYVADRASAAARATLDPSSFIQYQQTLHITYVKMMPSLHVVAVLAAAGWLILLRSKWRRAEFWFVAASICAMVSVVVMTRVVNVPLNNQLMTWSVSAPPANLRELWAPWERTDAIRTMVEIAGFVMQTFALCVRVPSAQHSSL